MKKSVRKIVCLVLTLALAMSLSVAAFATEQPASEEFTPSKDSTWGDLYRHFDAEGFASLPLEIQKEYDSVLLDSEDSADPTMASEEAFAVDEVFETSVSASAYLYYETDDNEVAPQSINIAGLLDLLLGVSSTKTEIDYTVGLYSTITCPWMYCSVTIYDEDTGKFVDFDSSIESDPTKVCSVDGTFDGLKSKHEYRLKAFGNVTPPTGYYISGPLTVETTKETK